MPHVSDNTDLYGSGASTFVGSLILFVLWILYWASGLKMKNMKVSTLQCVARENLTSYLSDG